MQNGFDHLYFMKSVEITSYIEIRMSVWLELLQWRGNQHFCIKMLALISGSQRPGIRSNIVNIKYKRVHFVVSKSGTSVDFVLKKWIS